MVASSGKAAFGVTLTRAGYTIAELTSIGDVEVSADTFELTNHASDYAYREYARGMKDGGEVPIEGNFISSDTNGQVGLLTDFENGTIQDFVMTFPAAAMVATWTFKGIVKKFKLTQPMEGKIGFAAAIKITGKPALALTASNNCSNLVFGSGSLVPTFAAGTYEYVLQQTATATVTVTATFASGVGELYVNGSFVQALTSAVASGAFSTPVGVTKVEVRVTEAGKTTKTYKVHISRAS